MSKELEALKYLKENKRRHWLEGDRSGECLDIIESALKRLEEIDNKPVAFMVSSRGMENAIVKEISKHKEIKITNLADQKKLKAFEIIKKKDIKVAQYGDYYLIDKHTNLLGQLTKEEYELLKEILK